MSGPGPSPRPFAFDPIEEVLTRRWGYLLDEGEDRLSSRKAAVIIGTHPSCIRRWRTLGMTPPMADKVACSLGLHPLSVWPREWAEVLAVPAKPEPEDQRSLFALN